MISPILWQPVPALPLCYALESDSSRALDAARQLFWPWLLEANPAMPAPARRWNLRNDGDSWTLTAGDGARHQGALTSMLAHVEYGAVNHLVAHLEPPFIGLHGALLSRARRGQKRGVLIVGPKQAGKSTLACALWRAGWQLHCDDFTILDAHSRAHATARRVSLRAGSRALLGDLWDAAARTPSARPTAQGLCFHPHELSGADAATAGVAASGAPVELDAILFLGRRGAATQPHQSAPLRGIEAAFALLPYSTLLLDESGAQLTHERADWSAGLAILAARIEAIPLPDLRRAEPQAMVAHIEQFVASNSS